MLIQLYDNGTNYDILGRNQPPEPHTTNIITTNCHKKPRTNVAQNDTKTSDTALPMLLAELWKPLVHPLTEKVFITDKGERFEIPADQIRWKNPLGKRVVIIDTDTRLDDKKENTMLHDCPLDFPSLPGRTGGHLNHYIYGMTRWAYKLDHTTNFAGV